MKKSLGFFFLTILLVSFGVLAQDIIPKPNSLEKMKGDSFELNSGTILVTEEPYNQETVLIA